MVFSKLTISGISEQEEGNVVGSEGENMDTTEDPNLNNLQQKLTSTNAANNKDRPEVQNVNVTDANILDEFTESEEVSTLRYFLL